jgi:hypothetical protein
LFAGTERAVFVSFNDGDDWQPLRLNMPATSIRDLVIHDDDVVVGTHGRSFWILDDITPLRQIDAKVAESPAFLFQPQVAYRVRWNTNTDTPLPPEEPAGQNPADGAIIDYYLKEPATGPVSLAILDTAGKMVRTYSSTDKSETVDEKTLTIPSYWIRPPQILSADAGQHRFVWDLHYPPPEGGRRSYPMTAVYRNTPSEPNGPWAHPGQYLVRLTVGGKSYEQPLVVKMDPRVKTPPESLAKQFELSMQCYEGSQKARAVQAQIRKLRTQIKEAKDKAGSGEMADALAELDKKVGAFEGSERRRGERFSEGPREKTLSSISQEYQQLLHLLQGADAAPTSQAMAACADVVKSHHDIEANWSSLKDKEIKALNERLSKAGLPELTP